MTVAIKVSDCPKTEGFAEDVSVVDVAVSTGVIVTETAFEKLAARSGLPRYSAVNESVPAGSAVVARVAESPLRLAVPREVEPTKNCTDPVGKPDPGAITAMVAVSVTDWPAVAVVGLADRPVVVPAGLTVRLLDVATKAKVPSLE